MDYGRKILQNYGWKDGDGLGKKNNGIVKPLRATLKFDNAGFGADLAASDFNNHWWERVYNEAATNVNITKEGEQINLALKDDDHSVEISTKGYSVKKLKKLKSKREESDSKSSYDNFLKAATLTNLGNVENPHKIDTNDIEVSKIKVLTDEELFKVCGGRTAHKGARHGLNSSGKLARIQQQEAELLEKIIAKQVGHCEVKGDRNKLGTKSTKPENLLERCKEQRKKKHKVIDETQEVFEISCVRSGKLRKKKRKHYEIESAETVAISEEKAAIENRKKMGFCKQTDVIEIDKVGTLNMVISGTDHDAKTNPTKKKKKGKNIDKLF